MIKAVQNYARADRVLRQRRGLCSELESLTKSQAVAIIADVIWTLPDWVERMTVEEFADLVPASVRRVVLQWPASINATGKTRLKDLTGFQRAQFALEVSPRFEHNVVFDVFEIETAA